MELARNARPLFLTDSFHPPRQCPESFQRVLQLVFRPLPFGRIFENTKLSDNPGLLEAQTGSGHRLLPVEIRAILDEAQWNSPSDPSYGFIQGRKVWIIRNEILPDAPLSYSGVTQEHFPALISSAGRQELCAWIERVQIAYNGGALTDRGLTPLRPYLVPLAQEDRVRALRILLSLDARNFLAKIRVRWGGALTAD